MNAQFRAERLMRVYRNAGGEFTEFTKPFDAWPEHVRSSLAVEVGLAPDEVPLLAFVANPDLWTIVTLDRIAWKHGGSVRQASIRSLTSANIPEAVAASISPDVKRSMRLLRVVTEEGNEAVVEFEPGKPFFGFWNLVKMMISQRIGSNLARNEQSL